MFLVLYNQNCQFHLHSNPFHYFEIYLSFKKFPTVSITLALDVVNTKIRRDYRTGRSYNNIQFNDLKQNARAGTIMKFQIVLKILYIFESQEIKVFSTNYTYYLTHYVPVYHFRGYSAEVSVQKISYNV